MKSVRIRELIHQLEVNLNIFPEILPLDLPSFLKSIQARLAIERLLQICIENVLDICAMLSRDLHLGVVGNEDLSNYDQKSDQTYF